MPICPQCSKKIKRGDKIKVKGVWRHHHSSVKKVKTKVEVKVFNENKNLSDEQLIKKAAERGI